MNTMDKIGNWAKIDDSLIFDLEIKYDFFPDKNSHWEADVVQDSETYHLLLNYFQEKKSFIWSDSRYRCDVTKISIMIHNPGKATFSLYGNLKERDTAIEREAAISGLIGETYEDSDDIIEQ
jgi:hypothetical protein